MKNIKFHDDNTMLPCPFCGGKGETSIDIAVEASYARCTNYLCMAYTGRKLGGTRADAVEHWNRRVGSDYSASADSLAEALNATAQLAFDVMKQANEKGSKYDILQKLNDARKALLACKQTKGDWIAANDWTR